MAAGWKLQRADYLQRQLSDDEMWYSVNYFYSNSSKKRNTYKFGLIKAILDSVFSMYYFENGYYLSYECLFEKFTHNYWNLVTKYQLKQMRKDGRSEESAIEQILLQYKKEKFPAICVEFDSLCTEDKEKVVSLVKKECKRYVLGALYEDFGGTIYSFDLRGEGIYLNPAFYEFFCKYKVEIEKINYYEWAKFLETVNSDETLIRVIDKLELATPKREDLSLYRQILENEFEQHNCFYCGKKLNKKIHVDHFIPWSFVKDDRIWNFVLTCPTCNIKKNNRLADRRYVENLVRRNEILRSNTINPLIVEHFMGYSCEQLTRLWNYATMSGYRVGFKI